jgi:hypothetical protein
VLLLGGLIYLAFGLMCFINPYAIADMDGIILPTPGNANHIRSILGGTEPGLGLVLICSTVLMIRNIEVQTTQIL